MVVASEDKKSTYIHIRISSLLIARTSKEKKDGDLLFFLWKKYGVLLCTNNAVRGIYFQHVD